MTLLAHLISYQLTKHVERMLDPVRFPYLELPHFSLVPSVPQALISAHHLCQKPHLVALPILLPLQYFFLEHRCNPVILHNQLNLVTASPTPSQHLLHPLSTHGNPLQIFSHLVGLIRVKSGQTQIELFHLNLRLPSAMAMMLLLV